MKVQGQSSEGQMAEGQKVIPQNSRTGRLLRFLLSPPPLGALPLRAGGFARRLAVFPPDLVTHLGMVRSNAYFAAGCPLELCDHAAARDLWRVVHAEVIGGGQMAEDGEQRTD